MSAPDLLRAAILFPTANSPVDSASLDPRQFMPTPLDLIGSIRDGYAGFQAPKEGRECIKVAHFPDNVKTALESIKEHSDRGDGRRASDTATLACCVSCGMEVLRGHPMALDNTSFTRRLSLLKDCDLMAHEILARQFREFDVSLTVMDGGRQRPIWLPGGLANSIHGLAQNMGARPGELLMVAAMSTLSTQHDFLSDERCALYATVVRRYLRGYSFRGRYGLAALKVTEDIEAEEPDS